MNLNTDGTWISSPVTLATGDEIVLRLASDDSKVYGGVCSSIDASFAVGQGKDRIKAPKNGTYVIVYNPKDETASISTEFYGIVGDNITEDFMMYMGEGAWLAADKYYQGKWQVRKGADNAVTFGGSFDTNNYFTAVQGGKMMQCPSGYGGFCVVFNIKDELFLITQTTMY